MSFTMRLACWLVGRGTYLAARDHVRAQLQGRTYVDIGKTVLVAYSDWNEAAQAEQRQAAKHVKPNKRRAL